MHDEILPEPTAPAAGHLVQLFDDESSRSNAVTGFLAEGLRSGATLLVVSRKVSWDSFKTKLTPSGVPFAAAVDSGQLTSLNASDTLDRFMVHGRPNRARFEASVGALVRRLLLSGKPLRIYGEMVDILAAHGDYWAAQELEDLWNLLAAREPFTLLCGYSAANFGSPQTASFLRNICRAHSEVRVDRQDFLASFLVS